jgi:hypothetical protein
MINGRREGNLGAVSSGAAYVSLQIARVDFDFPAAPSGDGTRDNDNNFGLVVACGGMGGPCRSVLGGGDGDDRIRAMPAIESSLLDFGGAPLLAAASHPRAVLDANAPLDGSVGAPLLAAEFHLLICAVRDTNAPLDDSVGAPLLAAAFHPRAVRDANAPPDDSVGATLLAAVSPLRRAQRKRLPSWLRWRTPRGCSVSPSRRA